jgi:hypothetical protein
LHRGREFADGLRRPAQNSKYPTQMHLVDLYGLANLF